MAPAKPTFLSVVRGLAEPSLVLLTGFLLVSAIVVSTLPVTRHAMPLRPAPGMETLSREALTERAEALEGVDRAEVLLLDGTSQLVLNGVSEIDRWTPELERIVVSAGYQKDELRPIGGGDIETIMRADPGFLTLTFAIQALLLGVLGWVFGRRPHYRPPQESEPFDATRSVVYGLLAGLGIFAASWLVSVIQALVGFPAEEQAWVVELMREPQSLLRLAPWIVLFVPISEELMFRFYAMRYISYHAGFVTAAIASSLIFALMHANPTGLPAYTTIGLGLAWSYRKSGRIGVPILAHAVNNALALGLTLLFPDTLQV